MHKEIHLHTYAYEVYVRELEVAYLEMSLICSAPLIWKEFLFMTNFINEKFLLRFYHKRPTNNAPKNTF